MGCIAKKDYKEDNTSHGFTLEPVHIILSIATFGFLTLFSGLGLYCVRRKRRLQYKHEDLIYTNAASESQINERAIPKECASTSSEMEVISTRSYPSMTLGRLDHRKPRHQNVGHNQLNTHATLPVGFTANSLGSAATEPFSETNEELSNMTTIMYEFTVEGYECCRYPNQGERKSRASQIYSTISNN
uniref:Uncharacterized protein LOC111109915 n=1 Tax=Crassostrea virginica TaxID=6565 RepID=A0A8B8BGF7_CRAVI|nr:uncharacterized protein LOC111109915 [Crassostrea virginica]